MVNALVPEKHLTKTKVLGEFVVVRCRLTVVKLPECILLLTVFNVVFRVWPDVVDKYETKQGQQTQLAKDEKSQDVTVIVDHETADQPTDGKTKTSMYAVDESM